MMVILPHQLIGLTTFDNLYETTGVSINVGSNVIEKQSHSRINDINLVLRGGSSTGHKATY